MHVPRSRGQRNPEQWRTKWRGQSGDSERPSPLTRTPRKGEDGGSSGCVLSHHPFESLPTVATQTPARTAMAAIMATARAMMRIATAPTRKRSIAEPESQMTRAGGGEATLRSAMFASRSLLQVATGRNSAWERAGSAGSGLRRVQPGSWEWRVWPTRFSRRSFRRCFCGVLFGSARGRGCQRLVRRVAVRQSSGRLPDLD